MKLAKAIYANPRAYVGIQIFLTEKGKREFPTLAAHPAIRILEVNLGFNADNTPDICLSIDCENAMFWFSETDFDLFTFEAR